MDLLRTYQGPEITRILCHEDEILIYTSSQNLVVRRTEPAEVAWMYCDVNTFGIQSLSDPRREALIKEQVHCVATTMTQATLRQGRPDGRPRRG